MTLAPRNRALLIALLLLALAGAALPIVQRLGEHTVNSVRVAGDFKHVSRSALEQVVADQMPEAESIGNGEELTKHGVTILAVPMYNEKRGPEEGKLFHDKGRGNGYLLSFGETRIYISGDTECVSEMRSLPDIDLAFVCMNLPYTMPPEEAAECIKSFRPKTIIPYHYRGSDLSVLKQALEGEAGIELRLLDFYLP